MRKSFSTIIVSLMTFFSVSQGHSTLENLNYSKGSVKAVLTDIEGTTTSILFVHQVLFPYAKQNVGEFLSLHQNDSAVHAIIEQVKEINAVAEADVNEVAEILLTWMKEDKKITPLKSLQGIMWKEGYESGAFTGHLYEDAYLQMKKWKEEGTPLYVYSSGSVQAQKLLFSYSDFGDLTPIFSGYFDTRVGGKKEVRSYQNIADEIQLDPSSILFLSDIVEELDAAKLAGMQTLLLSREGLPPVDCGHPYVTDFNQITIQP